MSSPLDQSQSQKGPSFHRGTFSDEIENARTDLSRKMLLDGLDAESPSTTEAAPSLSPTSISTPSSPDIDAVESPTTPLDVNGHVAEGKEPLVADSFAFAFDIDGVLVRGGRPIPEAVEAMKVLNGKNKYGIKM
ncbi:hypothetical protein RRF57_004883 [Xylaria bambusicola]|uniref:Uncharacterized protein n=1 Tax=Xylaria bambusicola TaxID=326684 RepID=A0AAN7Z774_9PEZI